MVSSFVNVKIIGLKKAQLYLKNIERKTPGLALKLTEKMAQIIVRTAKEKVAPLNTGTGALKDSIEYHKKGNGYIVTAGKGLARPYAYYQEFGYTPHFIGLKNLDPKVRSRWGSKGSRFFVKHFFPYMSKGYRKALSKASIELKKTADKIAQ